MPVQKSGLGKIEPKLRNVEKFTADARRKYRIGFPLVNKDGTVRVDMVPFWNKFTDDIKIKALVTEDEECNKEITKVLGQPTNRYVTVACVYGTNDKGMVQKPLSYKLIPWVFSDGTLADLTNINEEFELATHDITATLKEGTDPKFQNLVCFPTSKQAIWTNEKIKDRIAGEANDLADSDVFYTAVANKMDCDVIKERAGMSTYTGANTDDDDGEDDGSVVIDDDDINIDDIV